jgi:hypothetical protein
MPARIALIVAALLVAACLAVTFRAVRLEGDARAVLPDITKGIPPADLARAESLLKSAETLNPDVRPLMVRAALLTGVKQHRRAAELVRRVLRREPDNALAAGLLLRNLRTFDPVGAAAAERHIRSIAPPLATR